MTNYKIGNDGVLKDSTGKNIGKSDYSGNVSSGGSSKGYITRDDRYIDEYGRDLGWVTTDGGDNSSTAGDIAGGLIVLAGVVGFQLISDARKNAHTKMIITVPAIIGFDQFFDLCLESIRSLPFNTIKEENKALRIIKANVKEKQHDSFTALEFAFENFEKNINVQLNSQPASSLHVGDGGKSKKILRIILEYIQNKMQVEIKKQNL